MHEGHNHGEHSHSEVLKRVTVMLEEDQVELLKELAGEYREKLGQRWTLSAMLRVAVGDFLNRMGKIS
ncbi:MAG: hypothetical protein HY889_05620 [Deltaproteobacteria bacterium]|nr:hypothetical protein [Deltaproteobacteria bacterium]